jgi:hypothetical protein
VHVTDEPRSQFEIDRLYAYIGALVVAASHVESALCRAICWVKGEPQGVTKEVAGLRLSQRSSNGSSI